MEIFTPSYVKDSTTASILSHHPRDNGLNQYIVVVEGQEVFRKTAAQVQGCYCENRLKHEIIIIQTSLGPEANVQRPDTGPLPRVWESVVQC